MSDADEVDAQLHSGQSKDPSASVRDSNGVSLQPPCEVVETLVFDDETTLRNAATSSGRHVASSSDYIPARGNGSSAAASQAIHYPAQMMYHPYFFHPAMFGSQPMSGMAGLGYAPLQNHHQNPQSSSTACLPSGSSGSGTANACPAAGTSGSGATRRKKDARERRSSSHSESESPQRYKRCSPLASLSRRREQRSPVRENSASPRRRETPQSYERRSSRASLSRRREHRSPVRECSPSPHKKEYISSSRAARSRKRQRRSISRGSSFSPRSEGPNSPLRDSVSPSSRRSFVQKARNRRSLSSSPPRSAAGEEEDQNFDEDEDFALSRHECLALIKELRPDLVSAGSNYKKKALSAGERSLSRHKSRNDALCFAQSPLVSDTLTNLQSDIRKGIDSLPEDKPADLPPSTLKTGDLLKSAPMFAWSSLTKGSLLLAEGPLPAEKLSPSSSDLTSRSKQSNNSFKPVLKEKGLLSLEESALRGLQSLSVSDSIMGIIADCLDDKQPLDKSYSRRPTQHELLQLTNFACRGITHAVDATARCYLNAVLIKRDSFLNSADKLPEEYDRSALRSLPISAPALIGPQVALNVKRWEKRHFDSSVHSIVARADKDKRSPRKRHQSAPSHRPASKFRRYDSSGSRAWPSSRANSGRGRPLSRQGKSKPKASAHPQ